MALARAGADCRDKAMEERRGIGERQKLCAGPGRVGQALAISKLHDGLPLDRPPFLLTPRDGDFPVVASKRIGISQALDVLWRFELAGSPFVSRRTTPEAAPNHEIRRPCHQVRS